MLTWIVAFAPGCSTSEKRAPVPDSTMVEMLIELHLSVARAGVTDEVPSNIRDSILTAYDVDSTAYADAIAFYAEHPQKYSEIYSRVLDRLNSERIPLGRASEDEAAPSSATPPRTVP